MMSKTWVSCKPGCRLTTRVSFYQKPKLIWFGTRQQPAKLDLSAISADFPHLLFPHVVRNLGVTLDQELTLAPHTHRLCRDSHYQLSALLFARLLQMPPLHLSMPSLQPD